MQIINLGQGSNVFCSWSSSVRVLCELWPQPCNILSDSGHLCGLCHSCCNCGYIHNRNSYTSPPINTRNWIRHRFISWPMINYIIGPYNTSLSLSSWLWMELGLITCDAKWLYCKVQRILWSARPDPQISFVCRWDRIVSRGIGRNP